MYTIFEILKMLDHISLEKTGIKQINHLTTEGN
jgi:hypothetical protein